MPRPAHAIREISELAALRRRVPWTQGELAAAAGVSVGTVRGIERNTYMTVRPRVMRALAAALRVAPAAVVEFRPSLGLPSPSAPPSPSPATATATAARIGVDRPQRRQA